MAAFLEQCSFRPIRLVFVCQKEKERVSVSVSMHRRHVFTVSKPTVRDERGRLDLAWMSRGRGMEKCISASLHDGV